ncbi:MAG: hypothetical protein QM831_15135 [Kofleriaceae bacterium]
MKKLALFALLFTSASFVPACGGDNSGDDAEEFATFQDCFDDHVGEFGDTPTGHEKAITTCCLDHPIGNAAAGVVCGADAASCDTYVDANVDDTATADEITAGCTDYETQLGS